MGKTTVQLIQEVSGQIETAITSVSKESKKSAIVATLTELSTSVSSAVTHLGENEKRKFIEVRKNLKAVSNIVEGILEGLASGDLNKTQFKSTINTLRVKFYPKVCTSLSVEIERAEAAASSQPAIVLDDKQKALKAELAEASDYKEALNVVKRNIKEAEKRPSAEPASEITDLATATQLHDLAQARNLLPVRLKTDFQIVRMPIVPIFSNYQMNNSATFAKLGVKHLLIEGYAVLLDQLLVAVSSTKASRSGLTTKAFAESVVSLLNERGNTEYDFVSDNSIPNPRNTDIELFWILSRPKMSALMRIAMSGRKANTVKWGLPF